MKAQFILFNHLHKICAILLFISLFLPWIAIPLLESYSLIGLLISGKEFPLMTGVFLILILVFSISNLLTQLISESPCRAFFLNVYVFFVSLRIIIGFSDLKDFDIVQPGLYLALIASGTSIIAMWTTVGLNYYSQYKTFLKNLTILLLIFLVSLVLVLLLSTSDFMMSDPARWSVALVFLNGLSKLLTIVLIMHIPFVLYCWLLVLVTKDVQKRKLQMVETSDGFALQEKESDQSDSLLNENVRLCPQCHKLIKSTYNYCPFCNVDLRDYDNKPKEKDDDNLRFAPPEYR